MITTESNKNISLLNIYLKSNNKRRTQEREGVLLGIHKINKEFSVDELHFYLLKQDYKLPRATIYNAIKILIKSNIIKELSPKKVDDSFSYVAMFELNK